MTQTRPEYLRWIVVHLWLTQVPDEALPEFKLRVEKMLSSMNQRSVDDFFANARLELSGGTIPQIVVDAVLATYDALNLNERTQQGSHVNFSA